MKKHLILLFAFVFCFNARFALRKLKERGGEGEREREESLGRVVWVESRNGIDCILLRLCFLCLLC